MKKISPNYASMRPLFRWLLWIVGGLLLLLIVLQILISLFADDYVAASLKDHVREASDSTYTLKFDDLGLNIFSGSLTISHMQINADTTAFSQKEPPPKKLFMGSVRQLKVSGIHVWSALRGDVLNIGSITITRPDITLLKNPNPVKKDTSQPFSSIDSTIYASISKRYRKLKLGEFNIKNAKGLFSASGDTVSSIDTLNLSLKNIRVDSASAHSGRQFITHNISFDGRHFIFNQPGGLNKIRFAELSISSDDQSISLDSLQMVPRYPRFKFSKNNGAEIDRIDLTVPEVQLQNVDFNRWIDSSRFYATNATISNAVMKDFRDKNRQFPSHNHPPLPHMALKNMRAKIKIDTVRVQKSYISYSEYWYQTPRAGRVTFEDLNATITHLSNYPEAIKNGVNIIMDARARVMGKGLLDTHFEFPMDTENGFHKVSGTLGAMPLIDFNPMLKYVAFVRIDKGMLNSLKFDMTLNNTSSSGNVIMNYENLKISVLDKKAIKQRGIKENLITFFANNVVLKKSNTPQDGMQAGRISFERIERKSIFNYWWKSLLSGIKASVK